MRILASLSCLLLATACGGKQDPPSTTPTPAEAVEPEPTDGDGAGYGGDTYGGAGYGDAGDDEVAEPTPAKPQKPDLVGAWTSTCFPDGRKGFMRLDLDFAAARWNFYMNTFKDAACSKRVSSIHIAGDYTIGDASPTVAGAWEGTFNFDTRELTADDARTAKALGKLCGVKLKAKTKADIQAQGCPALTLPAAEGCTAEYDLVELKAGTLRFGARPADGKLCTPELRPTALDAELSMTYVWKPTGLAECDAYFAEARKLMSCPKMPAEATDSLFEAMRMTSQAFVQLQDPSVPAEAKKAAADGCQAGADAVKQAIAAQGC